MTSTDDQSKSSEDVWPVVCVVGACCVPVDISWVAAVTRSIWAYGPSIGGYPPMTSAANRLVRMASCSPHNASQEYP